MLSFLWPKEKKFTHHLGRSWTNKVESMRVIKLVQDIRTWFTRIISIHSKGSLSIHVTIFTDVISPNDYGYMLFSLTISLLRYAQLYSEGHEIYFTVNQLMSLLLPLLPNLGKLWLFAKLTSDQVKDANFSKEKIRHTKAQRKPRQSYPGGLNHL